MITINNELMTDYGLYLLSKTISAPNPKRNTVSIPLTDGTIDLSKVLSPVMFYENRNIDLVFELMKFREDWQNTMILLADKFHGQDVEICIEDDPDHVWRGVAFVGQLEDHGSTAGLTISVDAKPFRRTKTTVSEQTISVSGTKSVTITHTHKRAYLNITPTAQMVVNVNGESETITPQKHSVEFTLTAPSTAISLTGSGSATLKVWGGDL